MLDVQQVRLRFIFVRALYLYCLFQKAYGRAIYPYAATENPQRIRTDKDVRGLSSSEFFARKTRR